MSERQVDDRPRSINAEDIMEKNRPASIEAPKPARQTKAGVSDLEPKSPQDVRGGRETTRPAVSEIVVTKDQDCSSTGL